MPSFYLNIKFLDLIGDRSKIRLVLKCLRLNDFRTVYNLSNIMIRTKIVNITVSRFSYFFRIMLAERMIRLSFFSTIKRVQTIDIRSVTHIRHLPAPKTRKRKKHFPFNFMKRPLVTFFIRFDKFNLIVTKEDDENIQFWNKKHTFMTGKFRNVGGSKMINTKIKNKNSRKLISLLRKQIFSHQKSIK